MTEGGWDQGAWGENGQREPLPKVDDLPIAEQGYDRAAVREAFDAFYRHTAQLDSTLRVLESVEVFGRQARELRADIRSLRAASWGPAPSARHVWSVGHEVWSPQEPPAAFAASLPRLAVWAALIVAVGVGAALAELSTVLIVLLVVAAWALVALIEVAIAGRRAAAVPAQLAPAALEPAPAAAIAQPPDAAAAAAQDTMIVSADERVQEAVEEPEADAAAAVDGTGHGTGEPETDAEPEADAAAAVAGTGHGAGEPEADAEPHPEPRRRFWRRRADAGNVDEAAAAMAAAGWQDDSGRGDPWEADAETGDDTGDDTAVGLDQPVVTAAPPPRGLLRRGRR